MKTKSLVLSLIFVIICVLVACKNVSGNDVENEAILPNEINPTDSSEVLPTEEIELPNVTESAEENILDVEDAASFIDGMQYELYGYAERRRVRSEAWTQEDFGVYWQLERNAMKTVAPIAKEMSEKGWENIECYQGFNENYPNGAIYYVNEEEELAPVVYVLEAEVNHVHLIVPIIFTEEYPEGKVTRVMYTGGRDWSPGEGRELEIVDAYDVDLWSAMYSY